MVPAREIAGDLVQRRKHIALIVVRLRGEGTDRLGNLAEAAEQRGLAHATLAKDIEDIIELVEWPGKITAELRELIVATNELAVLSLADAIMQAGAQPTQVL